jgi:hypothetical protein
MRSSHPNQEHPSRQRSAQRADVCWASGRNTENEYPVDTPRPHEATTSAEHPDCDRGTPDRFDAERPTSCREVWSDRQDSRMGCRERRSHGAQRPSLEYGLSQTKRHLTRASRPTALGVRRRRFQVKASLAYATEASAIVASCPRQAYSVAVHSRRSLETGSRRSDRA